MDNRVAIAYFAVHNRNHCLFAALKSFIDQEIQEIEDQRRRSIMLQAEKKKKVDDKDEKTGSKEGNGGGGSDGSNQQKVLKNFKNMDPQQKKMEDIFKNMLYQNDFLTLVMYPELEKRRIFVHDAF